MFGADRFLKGASPDLVRWEKRDLLARHSCAFVRATARMYEGAKFEKHLEVSDARGVRAVIVARSMRNVARSAFTRSPKKFRAAVVKDSSKYCVAYFPILYSRCRTTCAHEVSAWVQPDKTLSSTHRSYASRRSQRRLGSKDGPKASAFVRPAKHRFSIHRSWFMKRAGSRPCVPV